MCNILKPGSYNFVDRLSFTLCGLLIGRNYIAVLRISLTMCALSLRYSSILN
ncbi:hypothetical protein Hanom_Chr10g00933471 [Helianthus anomalus]